MKPLAIVGAVLAVTAIAFAAVMIPLIQHTTKADPAVTAFAYGRTITVEPYKYCDIHVQSCHDGTPANMDIPAGQPVQLSLPKAISDGPWRLLTIYRDTNGQPVGHDHFYSPGTTAVTVPSYNNMPIAVIEIQQPSALVDQSGLPYTRSVWSIHATN